MPATNLNSADNVIECRYDQGTHGNNSGTGGNYIATSGTDSYTTDDTDADIKWTNLSNKADLTMVSGNYMNYLVTAGSGQEVKKIDVVRNVIENVMFGVNGVNIGLMKFNHRSGGGLDENRGAVYKYPVIDVATTRNDLVNMKKLGCSKRYALNRGFIRSL